MRNNGITILGSIMILWSIQSLFSDFYSSNSAFKAEKEKSSQLEKLYLVEQGKAAELRAKLGDQIALKVEGIRVENVDAIYDALRDCTDDLNTCMVKLSNSESEYYGVMLEGLHKNKAEYEQILQMAAYPE